MHNRRVCRIVAVVVATVLAGCWLTHPSAAQDGFGAGPTGGMIGRIDASLQDDSRATGPPRSIVTVRESEEPRDAFAYFRPLRDPPKTLEALRKPVSLKYLDQPLERLIEEFQNQTGVPFFLDEAGLEEAAITSDAEVTFYAHEMTASVALTLALMDMDLDYLANEEYVLVTSAETASTTRETRSYALVDHPLLRGEDGLRFARAVRTHAELARSAPVESVAVDVLPGALVVTADRRSLAATEDFLQQYARVLSEYDAESGPAPEAAPEVETRQDSETSGSAEGK